MEGGREGGRRGRDGGRERGREWKGGESGEVRTQDKVRRKEGGRKEEV